MAALLVCGYCYADELTTVTAPNQAGVTNKQAVQHDSAAAALTVYPKETTRRLLPNKRGDLLHIAFEEGYIGKGVTLEPVVLQSAYTIEVILKPSEKQVPSAVVLGNIYGNKEGFRIQHDPIEKNTYAMSFNDGERWHYSVKFKLRAETWNYLAVVGDENVLQVYVDGSLIGRAAAKNKMQNTSRPVVIGNWEWKNWPFNGQIAEVRMANSSLDEKDIARRWNKLKPRLPKF